MDKKEYLRQYRIANKGKTKRYFVTAKSEDAKRFDAKAEAENMTPSTRLLKFLLADINENPLASKEAVEELRAYRFDVSNIANNINQIAHHVNIEKHAVNQDEVVDKLLFELKKFERASTKYLSGGFKHDY